MTDSLYIIDGHAQIYRAYYAMPPGLRSRTGEPTNATYGFAVALLKLIQNRRPNYLALAMDAGASQRDQLDPQYKAQRKPMPEDLPPQIERICQMTAALEIPILRVEGFEADDVIATLVDQLRGNPQYDQLEMFICSRDKDLDSLIDPRVRLYDIQTEQLLDAEALLAQKGYRPEQAPDVLALTGDAVDNIPGVPGVGPKTAAKWITAYGSLDALLAHADEIKSKAGEALRQNRSVLEQARRLVRLRRDVPLQVDLAAMHFAPSRLERLTGIFQELDFQRLAPTLHQVRESLQEAAEGRRRKNAGPPGGGDDKRASERATVVHVPRTPTEDANGANLPYIAPIEESPLETLSGVVAASQPIPAIFRTRGHAEMATRGGDPGTLFAAPATASGQNPEDESATVVADSGARGAGAGTAASEVPAPPRIPPDHVHGDYRLVNTNPLLDQMLAELTEMLGRAAEPLLAVDTETDALPAMRGNLCGISLCAREGLAWYVAVKGAGDCLPLPTVRDRLGPLLRASGIKKIGQNLKYDINVLRNHGLPLEGVFFDTMVASYVLDASRRSHALDALARDHLRLRMTDLTELIGAGRQRITMAAVPLEKACRYSAADADVTWRLAALLWERLRRERLEELFFTLEMPIVTTLADMEYAGVKVDIQRLGRIREDVSKKLENLRVQIHGAAGVDFNPDSPKQTADVLFQRLGLNPTRRNKSGPSTDMDVLESLAERHPVPALLLEYRQLAKLKNTYLEALAAQVLPGTGRVHASFNQTIAETGRLSSSEPNLQNIPIRTEWGREIRRAFVAQDEEFCLLAADYSQIELRLLAHFCGEPALLEAFAADQDIHRFVAARIHHVAPEAVTSQMRRVAKTVNFGIIYGQSAFGLAQVLKIPRAEAEAFIHAYKVRFPRIETFTEQCVQQAKDQGYVTTILGRRRQIPEIQSPHPALRNFGRRAAVNTVIQGSAADLIKQAMVNLHRRIGAEPSHIRMILQVHDELLFECRRQRVGAYTDLIRHEMVSALPLAVPLKVDMGFGDNWLEAKEGTVKL